MWKVGIFGEQRELRISDSAANPSSVGWENGYKIYEVDSKEEELRRGNARTDTTIIKSDSGYRLPTSSYSTPGKVLVCFSCNNDNHNGTI